MDKACACQELARPVYVSGASGNYTEADLRQAMSRLAMRALDTMVQSRLALHSAQSGSFSSVSDRNPRRKRLIALRVTYKRRFYNQGSVW